MDVAQGSFARRKEQLSTLLEHDICGTMNEIVAEPMRDRRKRAHTARNDRHTHGEEGSARNRGTLIARHVCDAGEPLNLINCKGCLVEQRAAAPGADHQVGLDGRITQPFEQANSVDRPSSARYGDDESLHTGSIYRRKAASGAGAS